MSDWKVHLEFEDGSSSKFWRARIDGKDLGWFLFDTGGPHFFLERAAAKSAGLGNIGVVPLSGIGGAAAPASLVKAGTITIGPMTVREPVIVVGDLNLQALGEPVVGVIGFPLVARCVLEFDPEGTALRVFKPGPHTLPAGDWVNSTPLAAGAAAVVRAGAERGDACAI